VLWERARVKIAPGFFHGAIPFEYYLYKSGLRLLLVRGLRALRFQLRELLGRKNCFGLFKECLPSLLGATGLYAFRLPRLDLCFLIGREIERCQIDACHRVRLRDALGAACLVSCKRTGCRQHRDRN
jgi:hypothetical protein